MTTSKLETSGLKEITATPQAEAVADAIRRLIGLGVYGPNDRLPSERELASQFGVGRMTLRAAIRQLSKEGLVVTSRGRSGGTRISERKVSKRFRREYLENCEREMRENYEFRQSVEPLAALLCAERATNAQKKEILDLVEMIPSSFDEYRRVDSRFHALLGEYCGNRLVAEAVLNAREQFFLWADPIWSKDSRDASEHIESNMLQHQAIAKAISLGKTTHAWNQMITHLQDGEANFILDFNKRFGDKRS